MVVYEKIITKTAEGVRQQVRVIRRQVFCDYVGNDTNNIAKYGHRRRCCQY